jgi:exopolysaccharide biosynthesis polyprenyl glycosylphosphotransferase
MAGLGVLWLFLGVVADIYDIGNAGNSIRTHRATVAAFVACALFRSAYRGGLHFEWVSIPFWAMPVVSIFTVRSLYVVATKALSLEHRTLIFGAGPSGREIAQALVERGHQRGYDVIGYIDDDPEKQGMTFEGLPVLGGSEDMICILERERVDVVVMAVNSSPVIRADSFPHLLSAREAGVSMVSMPTMYETILRKVAVSHAGANFGVFFPLEDYRSPFSYDLLKRIVDIAAGFVGCALFVLVAPFVMLANRFGNPGPLLYSQVRVGQGGRPFRIYKMRSMVVDAEKSGAQWCQTDDPRITKFGNILRKTRLDEIPQFWNVLRGDMSLIGPRPERPEFVSVLEQDIPFYRARHAVKPGLTGWAQVEYRYGASREDALVKLQYDLYYIKKRSILIDLRIMAKTLPVVFGAKGR